MKYILSKYFEFIYKIRMLYYNYNNREKKSFLDLNLRQINMDFECTFTTDVHPWPNQRNLHIAM